MKTIIASVFDKRERRPVGKRYAHLPPDVRVKSEAISRMTNATISELLDIKPHEAVHLRYLDAAPRYGSFARIKPVKLTRQDRRHLRHIEIQKIVRECGEVPSLRQMAAMLNERGHRAAHNTVRSDYEALRLDFSGNSTREALQIAA